VRRWRDLPRFFWSARACINQAKNDPKCLAGATYPGPGLTFWTATIWEDEASMVAYVRTPPHGPTLRYLKVWCSEAATGHLEVNAPVLPKPEALPALLSARPKFFPVKHPAMDHEQRWIPSSAPSRINQFHPAK
jgi:hypothetical protein